MLHILLVILKILGIILACLLGLLLLLVLIVLYVPIRYRVDVKKREEVIIKMRANWLMRIVFMRGWFINKQLHIKLRIFGFTLYDNLRPKKEKKAKKTKKAKGKKTKGKKISQQIVKKSEKVEETETIKQTNSIEDEKEEFVPSADQQRYTEGTREGTGEGTSDQKQDTARQKTGKIKSFFMKLKEVFQKISKFGTTIKTKVTQVIDLVKKLLHKRSLVSIFLNDEVNRAGIKLSIAQLLELLKHCGPQKVEGYVKFGTGDPESTGKLLGAVAFLYGFYGKNVSVEPDFEKKVFEAEGTVKGRIRIIRLLIITLKVIRDDNFKALRKNVRKLKEEL